MAKCGFVTASEARKLLKDQLMNGWIAIFGDAEGIEKLEYEVYTPGTDKNQDFEMFGLIPIVFTGKKTDDLRKLLGNQPDFDKLIAIEFHGHAGTGELVNMLHYNTDKADSVSKLVADITEDWGGRHGKRH